MTPSIFPVNGECHEISVSSARWKEYFFQNEGGGTRLQNRVLEYITKEKKGKSKNKAPSQRLSAPLPLALEVLLSYLVILLQLHFWKSWKLISAPKNFNWLAFQVPLHNIPLFANMLRGGTALAVIFNICVASH